MNSTIIFGVIASAVGIFGGYGVWRQVRAQTAAERDRAESGISQRITTARSEERMNCADRLQAKDDRIRDILADLDRETNRADTQTARADALQAFINGQRGQRDS